MRLSETFLEGFGINPKKVQPKSVLDVIDGMLSSHQSVQESITDIKELSGVDYTGDIGTVSFLASDKTLMKLLDKPKAANLYVKLYASINHGTTIALTKETIEDCIGKYKHFSSLSKALALVVNEINNHLKDCVVIHKQANKVVSFVVLKGGTKDELLKALSESGMQSPVYIDKVQTLCAIKGIT